MNGRRGLGEVWLVILIVLVIIVAVGALGVALVDQRDAGEQAAEDRPTPTQDVFEPPGVNVDDVEGVPGTPHASSAGADASAAHDLPRIAGHNGHGAGRVNAVRVHRAEDVA